MTSTAIHFARKWLLSSVAVHVRLQRTWAGEPLVANLALVLLLRARRNLGAELAHHGLRGRRHACAQQCVWAGKGSRAGQVDGLGGGAVVGHGAVSSVVAIRTIAGRGYRRVCGMCRREAIRIGRAAAGAVGAVDVSWGDVRLAEGDHAATGIQGVAKTGAGWLCVH